MNCQMCGAWIKEGDVLLCEKCLASVGVNSVELQSVNPVNSGPNKLKKNPKRTLIIVSVIVLVCGVFVSVLLYFKFFGIFNSLNVFEQITNSTAHKYGNTTGNIVNDSEVAERDGWIYYPAIASDNRRNLYKIRTDGTDKIKIDENGLYNGINVVGDWIYYRGIDRSNWQSSLYKIRTNGTEKKKIDSNIGDNITVVDNWIYYIERHIDSGKPSVAYKIRTDGSEKTKINIENPCYINVIGDWIYYTSSSNNSSKYYLYKVRTNGTGRTKIIDDINTGTLNVVNGWIYYDNIIDFGDHKSEVALYKVRIDGSSKTKIDDGAHIRLNIYGDWVYYIVNDSGNESQYTMYKIKTDGSNKTKVGGSVYPYGYIYVIDGWVYYDYKQSYGDPMVKYKIRTDGTDNQRVN